MLKGKNLIADIDAYRGKNNEFALWWIGQSGFIVKLGKVAVYIDPFLSDNPDRLVSSLLLPEEVTNADLVVGTHDHDDHIDRNVWPVLAASSPAAKFIIPAALMEALSADLGIPRERFTGVDDQQSVEVKGIRITGIAAAHETLYRDAKTGRYPYLGYVIEGNSCAIYHSGDTCIYEGLQTKLRRWTHDLILLPINGRDAERFASGCIGNMTYQESADLAGALEPNLTIPTHFDMFATNSEDPAKFVNYMRVKYPHLKVQVCEYGKRMIIAKDTSKNGGKPQKRTNLTTVKSRETKI